MYVCDCLPYYFLIRLRKLNHPSNMDSNRKARAKEWERKEDNNRNPLPNVRANLMRGSVFIIHYVGRLF